MSETRHEGKHTDFVTRDGWEFIQRKEKKDVVACIAMTPDNKNLIAVKQFRKPIGAPVLELPAGLVDKGETIKEAALRELKEETGYNAQVSFVEGPFTKSAGITDEAVWLVTVHNLEKGEQNLQDNEAIEIIEVPIASGDRFLGAQIGKGCAVDGMLFMVAEMKRHMYRDNKEDYNALDRTIKLSKF